MAGVERDPSELVQVKIRCRERLRLQLEAEAEKSGNNLTTEIVRRLEKSLADEAQERTIIEMQGGWKTARLCSEIVRAVRFFGVDGPAAEEPLMRSVLTGAIEQILNERLSGYVGLISEPTSEPRPSDFLLQLPSDLEVKARKRGALIGHHITLATRMAEEEAAKSLPPPVIEGETLVQAAVRMGLLDGHAAAEVAEKEAKPKKSRKRAQ